MIPSLARKIFEFFIFSSLFIAVCALLMVVQTITLFGIELNPLILGFVAGGTICSYNFHWYLSPPDTERKGGKGAWTVRNRKLHGFLAIAGALMALYFSTRLLQHWPWLLSTAFITFLYSAPKIPHTLFRQLKQVAVAKTVFLALAWTHVTAILPLVIVNPELDHAAIIFCVNRFFFIYAICILFDYRDRESDWKEGVRSMITQFSEAGIDTIFWSSLLVFLLTSLALCWHLPLFEALVLALPGAVLAGLYSSSKKNFSDYRYYFVLDGLMMLSAPFVILAKFVR